jgi:hypothetical protein
MTAMKRGRLETSPAGNIAPCAASCRALTGRTGTQARNGPAQRIVAELGPAHRIVAELGGQRVVAGLGPAIHDFD